VQYGDFKIETRLKDYGMAGKKQVFFNGPSRTIA
jgi:hypothetical protein